MSPARPSLFRNRTLHEHHRVTFIELFFDLVFVFAVTQLSHRLLEDFGVVGLVEAVLLLLAVWWVWVHTSWITNWLDPQRPPVRLMLLVLTLGGLGLSTSIPRAFDSRSLVFASTYVAMQIGRTLSMLRAIPHEDVALRRNFLRVLVWFTVAAPFFIAGALTEPCHRLALWSVALAIEYAGPALRFWTPMFGRSQVTDWAIEGGHLAERCGSFIIIALGESILITGATISKRDWTVAGVATFVATFTGTVAMWWIYFDKGAELGALRIATDAEPGRLARLAYTYLHLPIVAGIVLYGVADEVVTGHGGEHGEAGTVLSVVGGPLMYLLGVALFKRAVRERVPWSHVVGMVALLAVVPFAHAMSAVVLVIVTSIVLTVVAAWESMTETAEGEADG